MFRYRDAESVIPSPLLGGIFSCVIHLLIMTMLRGSREHLIAERNTNRVLRPIVAIAAFGLFGPIGAVVWTGFSLLSEKCSNDLIDEQSPR